MTPRQLQALHLLCVRGEASHLAMQMVAVGEDAGIEAVKSVVFQLKRRLPAELRIIGIYGWGYRLEQLETAS